MTKERKELRRKERVGARERQDRNRAIRRVILWGGVILGAGGIVVIIATSSLESPVDGEQLAPSLIELLSLGPDDHMQGDREAKVTLVEYSDFQCPACASYHPLLEQLVMDFGGDILFVYRHFPLKSIHKNAELAARAAEAAGKQGKFWEMHDTIFEHQNEWSNESDARTIFLRYGERLELEKAKFDADLVSQDVKGKVDQDLKSGEALGVNATPTFFLNGKKIENPRTYEELKTIIQKGIDENP